MPSVSSTVSYNLGFPGQYYRAETRSDKRVMAGRTT
jgi:hypothetical protein